MALSFVQWEREYRGKRYSFGYPACSHLEDQTALRKLLRPEEIGVQVTEGMMRDLEATVSALLLASVGGAPTAAC
jgi:5-methyltetrahydrofolate--homocysteine methyltransferase